MTVWQVKHELSETIALMAYKNFDLSAPHVFFEGKRLAASWQMPEAHINPAQPNARVVDMPWFEYGAILCNEKAWSVLQPYIKDEVEVLPVNVEGFHYMLLNPINVIDCLDRNKSSFDVYHKTGRVTRIDHYVFQEDKLDGVYLFKTPELIRTQMYATDSLRSLVLSHSLTGLKFEELP